MTAALNSPTSHNLLSTNELIRYSRQISLPQVGREGQSRLKKAKILCIGAGGLGSPVTMHLAAAGVGTLGVVDDDVVELSNLHRQLLHGSDDLGRPKVETAARELQRINPEVEVITYPTRFTAANAMELAAPYDLIIDGTDNFPTRYLSNDLAVLTKKPNVYGSIFRFEGQVSVFAPHLGGPCYRCLFPTPPKAGEVPSCAEGGVLGVMPGIIGCLQASEAIKMLLGIGSSLIGRLCHFDALAFRFREIKLKRDPDCAVCGDRATIHQLTDIEDTCPMSQLLPDEIDVHQLKSRIDEGTPFLLLDIREPEEIEVAQLPGSIKIPLGELADRLGELDPHAEIIIHCKSGGRSRRALDFMVAAGFTNICHVQGGINAWSREIDSEVPLY